MVSKPRFWQKAPAVRLLLPLCAGILSQWYYPFSASFLLVLFFFSALFLVVFELLSVARKFRLSALNGIFIHFLFVVAGAGLVHTANIQHHPNWIGNTTATAVLLKLEEPLVAKPNSYKAVASVQQAVIKGQPKTATGKVIIYFKKDSAALKMSYGSLIVVTKELQPIKNSGNPGSFDFKRYSLFNGTTHQVYLTPTDFLPLPEKDKSRLKSLLFASRATVISILKENIKGEKEQGLAEALLIGYKDDLDKALVQSYANTGVIHVIAISGLHLGLIYFILLLLTKPLKHKKTAPLRLLIILCGLWGFSLLAGAQPSILRSAVMFSAIATSTVINRRTSIYNTLALSALLLLLYNPFWLWDIGFQLSYSAVLSIIIFFKPIYNWIYFPNKAIDFIWSLAAASLAAQILTVPISIYYFNQFPTLFLVANLFAVPLSSLILIGEILLCAVSFIPVVAPLLGRFLGWLIGLMNTSVENLDNLQFAVWEPLFITAVQAALLYIFIGGIGFWLLQKTGWGLRFAAIAAVLFLALRSLSVIEANSQKKLIVYNVSKSSASDIISGRSYIFMGDTALEQNRFLRNFHLRPARTRHRALRDVPPKTTGAVSVGGKQIMWLNTVIHTQPANQKPVVHVLVLGRSPRVFIADLLQAFTIKQLVIDSSVPAWKARQWKNESDSLRLRYHDVAEKGAFVMDL